MPYTTVYPEVSIGGSVFVRGERIPDDATTSEWFGILLGAGVIVPAPVDLLPPVTPVDPVGDSVVADPAASDGLLELPDGRAGRDPWVAAGLALNVGSEDELRALQLPELRDIVRKAHAEKASAPPPSLPTA